MGGRLVCDVANKYTCETDGRLRSAFAGRSLKGTALSSTGHRSISWKRKAALQRWLSRCPFGFHANYLLQRYVQRSLPVQDSQLRKFAMLAAAHIEALSNYSQKEMERAVWLEIGAGTDLAVPILLYANGADRQLTLDIKALARHFLVNAAIAGVRGLDLSLRRPPAKTIAPSEDLRVALRHDYGINYLAPLDARRTGLPANSIDLIHSTNTLEHIPAGDLRLILNECHRLLALGGLLSLHIDYRDHYSYADRGISVYNFLQYSDATWSRFNCSLQYQNRLRHPDYLKLAELCGFHVVSDRPVLPSDADMKIFAALKIDQRFSAYDSQSASIQGSHMIMTRK
jgi:SAM-dependent methyltransferase